MVSIRIFVRKIWTGETILLHVAASDTVLSAKAQLQEIQGVSPNDQELYFAGRLLDSWRTLSFYGIQACDILPLSLRCHRTWSFQIFIKTSTGEISALEVDFSFTIAIVKVHLQDSLGITPNEHCLTFAGRFLDNSRMLSDYGVYHLAVLRAWPSEMMRDSHS